MFRVCRSKWVFCADISKKYVTTTTFIHSEALDMVETKDSSLTVMDDLTNTSFILLCNFHKMIKAITVIASSNLQEALMIAYPSSNIYILTGEVEKL